MNAKSIGSVILLVVLTGAFACESLAWTLFRYRNPKANATTFFTYYVSVMCVRRVPTFQ
jgi:hypothetical protein